MDNKPKHIISNKLSFLSYKIIFVFLFKDNPQLDFGRQSSTCPELAPPIVIDPNAPWVSKNIIAAEPTTFRATMGQAGGRRGYEGITGM